MKQVLFILISAMALSACKIEPNKADRETATELVFSDSLTYWGDIAPIVFENCTPCHHEEGGAPFPLTSYLDLRKRSKTIRLVIADHIMPPWPADTTYSRFKNEKTITELERKTILAWIAQGGIEGDYDPTLTPKFISNSDLGKPDLILEFPESIQIPGDNSDFFNLVKLPFELDRDTVIKAIAFVPGNKQLVHHVNGHLINYIDEKKAEPLSGEWVLNAETTPSISAYNQMQVLHDDGSYPAMLVSAFNYLPGVEPVAYPGDLGNVILNKKGAFIMNTLHYGPSAKDTFDLSALHLYFTDQKPERPLKELQLGTLGVSKIEPEFIIPPGSIKTFTTKYKVASDISVLTVNPHMHLLGKEIKGYAVSPTGNDTINLINIPRWDFRWQYFYTYPQMLKIPADYVITIEAIFDNTNDNPNNPFFPPRSITTSGEHMKTTDEMFQFFITYVPYQKGDEFINL